MNDMPGTNAVTSLLGMLVAVIAVIVLAYWCTKRLAGFKGLEGFRAASGGGQLRVLAQTGVGKDQRVMVLEAGERFFLLGVTASQISMLAELTAEEAGVWRAKEGDPAAALPSFREALRSCISKKK